MEGKTQNKANKSMWLYNGIWPSLGRGWDYTHEKATLDMTSEG